MTIRRTLPKLATAALALSLAGPAAAQSTDRIPVVATFSILGDMVQRIGGEHVAVTTLVGPNGDTHVYEPTPADARAVSKARVLIVNGLEFEGWLDRLVDASDFDGMRVVATDGIEPIAFDEGDDHHKGEKHHEGEDHAHDKHEHGKEKHAHDKHEHEKEKHAHDKHEHEKEKHAHDKHEHEKEKHAHDKHEHEKEKHAHDKHEHEKEKHAHDKHEHEKEGHGHHHHGAFDPHAWQSLRLAVTYVDNITNALVKADPANAAGFQQRRAAYVAEIEALDVEIREMVASLPTDRRTVVTSHDAFQYFGRDYGLTFLAPQGLSTESEASAKDVARLIKQMREEEISAAFVENITDSRLLEQIAKETGATIGGTLYPGALSGPGGPAPTYLDMMRHNATTLTTSLRSAR